MIEQVYDIVRKEQAIFFVGAGMSIYAGYPSGKQLKDLLINSLSPAEIKEVNVDCSLAELTEQYSQIKGGVRQPLLSKLKEIFGCPPKDTSYHEKLAQIPHIKTYITTNYDLLLEQTIKTSHIIKGDVDIPYTAKKQVEIFKIHGDIATVDSIIISTSDYTRFFDSQKNGLMWNAVKERVAANNVVFVGYNLDDVNIESIFKKIEEQIGLNRKQIFVISPNLSKRKKDELTRKNFQYIDMTGEEFTEGLLADIKQNIVNDIEKGYVSADTYRQFITQYGLKPELEGCDSNFTVKGFNPISGRIDGKLNMKLKGDSDFVSRFNQFIQGEDITPLEIDEQNLVAMSMFMNGIKVSRGEQVKLKLRPRPTYKGTIDISVNKVRYDRLKYETFFTPKGITVSCDFDTATVVIQLTPKPSGDIDVNFNYKHSSTYGSSESEIKIFQIIKEFADGYPVSIFYNSELVITKGFPDKNAEMLEMALWHIDVLKKIQLIEQKHDLRFNTIKEIDEKAVYTINQIVKAINNESYIVDFNDEATAELDSLTDEDLAPYERMEREDCSIVILNKELEIVELFGKEIPLGYKRIMFRSPYIVNKADIFNHNTNVIRLKDRLNQLSISYSENIEEDYNIALLTEN